MVDLLGPRRIKSREFQYKTKRFWLAAVERRQTEGSKSENYQNDNEKRFRSEFWSKQHTSREQRNGAAKNVMQMEFYNGHTETRSFGHMQKKTGEKKVVNLLRLKALLFFSSFCCQMHGAGFVQNIFALNKIPCVCMCEMESVWWSSFCSDWWEMYKFGTHTANPCWTKLQRFFCRCFFSCDKKRSFLGTYFMLYLLLNSNKWQMFYQRLDTCNVRQ